MSNIHRFVAVIATAGAFAAVGVAGASADDAPVPTVCDGTLSNTIVQDLTVPYGANCTLSNVVVDGSLIAEIDSGAVKLEGSVVTGDLTTRSRRLELRTSAVLGNLVAREAREGVVLSRGAVGGDTTIVNAATELKIGESFARGNVFGGSLVVDRARVAGPVAFNLVGTDLIVRNARAEVQVRSNLVGGALNCTANSPEPTGGSNLAGTKLDQCAAL